MRHQQTDIAEFLEMKKFFEENDESADLIASCFPNMEQYELFCGLKLNKDDLVHVDISRSSAPIYLKTPQRPDWDYEETSQVILSREAESFSKWRGAMREIEQNSSPSFCLYEKNIELWRQLWRVTERCDFIMQVLDCRNPNAYRSLDLEEVIAEKNKMLIFVLNKADLINEYQRTAWANYLRSKKRNFIFFASKTEGQTFSQTELAENGISIPETKKKGRKTARLRGSVRYAIAENHDVPSNELAKPATDLSDEPVEFNLAEKQCSNRPELLEHLRSILEKELSFFNSTQVCTLAQVHIMLRTVERVKQRISNRFSKKSASTNEAQGDTSSVDLLKAGLIGFPNVGKSSFFNSVINRKKAATGARPGKTKYFQSMYLPGSDSIVLHDSPGMLFPSLSRSRSSALCEGKVCIQASKNHEQCLIEACKRLDLEAIEARYKIKIPDCKMSKADEFVDALLTTYAYSRGHIGAFNQPLKTQAALRILQDYVKGYLVYAAPPPMEPHEYANILTILKNSPTMDDAEKYEKVFKYIEETFIEKGLHGGPMASKARDFFINVELSPIEEQPYLLYELYFNLRKC
ncbi:GTP-binding protein [Perkinsela sp. CCAP 1560/4]|nr:GTP-binding protein [Perkinsela sp. CCAP 1560/4]|eukprot:KNH07477.1 GTP-binding protein [Perkinsela sp. CCAP 1560/4]